MKVRETLERIAAFPMTHEFNDAQVRAMHQFMLGWRNYDELIKIAREAAGERPNKLIEKAAELKPDMPYDNLQGNPGGARG